MIYRALSRLILQRLPAESSHRLAAGTLRALSRIPGCAGIMRRWLVPHDPALRVHALGLSFPTPLGVAAGVDKDAEWFEGLGLLGFGHVEVGTVTARPQAGNPRPRLFRMPREGALLNRMGFPNAGARAVAARLRRRSGRVVVGANVGKGAATPIDAAAKDYGEAVRVLAPACDYLVVNVSSPNTPRLREMQTVDLLRPLLLRVRRELASCASEVPLLVKIAPDTCDEQVDAIADLALELALDGIVAVNTTEDRGVLSAPEAIADVEGGGISGVPLKKRAVEVLERLHRRVGDRLVLVSAGGIWTPEDAWERILAGATLVQAYTGFVYGGPGWPSRINRSLARRVRASGANSIQELIGARETPARG